jgi:hypothetical protein
VPGGHAQRRRAGRAGLCGGPSWIVGLAGVDLGGQTSLTGLAAIIARAGCLVVGNTGPAHLAAALGTPVVSLFAPTVSFGQWGPYRVPAVRLGDASAGCRHTRATRCPVPGHPCLSSIEPATVVEAVRLLGGPVGPGRARPDPGAVDRRREPARAGANPRGRAGHALAGGEGWR